MSLSSTVRSRIDYAPLAGGLAVGDLVAITAFVVVGQLSHGYSPLTDAGRLAGTLVPFLVGWALVSFAGGLYRRVAIETVRRAVLWTLPAWLVAVAIAQPLRATAVFPGNASATFAMVAAGFGGLMLVAWRLAATVSLSR